MQTNTISFILSFILFCCTTHISSAQTLTAKNQKLFGGSGGERIYAIKPTADNGLIFTGVINSWIGDGDVDDLFRRQNGRFPQVDGNNDIWVVKLKSDYKTIEWQRVIGGSQFDVSQSILQTAQGDYMIAGYSYSSDLDVTGHHACDAVSATCRDGWILKLRGSDGALIWSKSYGGSGDENFYGIQPMNDGNFLVAGYTTSNDGDVTGFHDGTNTNNDAFGDGWLVKIDSSGKILWQKTYGGTLKDLFSSIAKTQDGGFIISGYTNSSDGDLVGLKSSYAREAWLVKLDATGKNIGWQNISSNPTSTNIDSRALSVKQTAKGEYVMSGTSAQVPLKLDAGGSVVMDFYIAKFDANGGLKWKKSYGGSDDDWGVNIISVAADDGVIVSGYTFSSDGDVNNYHGLRDAWMVRCDSLGNKIATSTFGGGDFDYIYTSTIDNFGKYIMAGATKSHDSFVPTNAHGDSDCWFFELDLGTATTCTTIGAVCNDNNPNTINDVIQSDCSCRGTNTVLTVNNCPQPITVTAALNATNAIVNWTLPTGTTTCTNGLTKITQTSGLLSGASFPIGTQNINYSIVDSCANAKTCIFSVTVKSPTIVYDCPTSQKNIGDACDDGNANTTNDKIQSDCTCKGTVIQTSGITLTCPLSPTINIPTGATTGIVTWNDPVATSTCTVSGGGGTSNCSSLPILGFTSLGTFGTSNYYLSTSSNQWDNAKTICQTAGGHLVTISSQAENDFILSKISSGNAVYIGLSDKTGSGVYTWADGTTNSYTNWESGTPNNNGASLGNYTMMASWSAGKWSNQNKYVAKPYIMEIECGSGGSGNGLMLTQTTGSAKGSAFPVGIQTISYKATDNCSNTQTCAFTVTVKAATVVFDCPSVQKNIGDACDDGNPNTSNDKIQSDCTCKGTSNPSTITLTCPASQTITATTGQTAAILTWALPTATTTCAGGLIKISQTDSSFISGSSFPVGTSKTITLNAKDSCSNTKSCNFSINVNAANTGSADIALRFQNTQTSFSKFTNFHYLIEAKNIGSAPMTNIAIQFKFPAGTVNGGTTIPSVGIWQSYCSGGVQCYEWDIPSLATNSVATLDAVVFILNVSTPIIATTNLLSSTPTDGNATNNSATLTLSPPLNLSIDQKPQFLPIVIEKTYPNPATQDLFMRLNSLIENEIAFKIFKSLGESVDIQKRKIEKGINTINFDLSNFENGVYYIQPVISISETIPVKFVKME